MLLLFVAALLLVLGPGARSVAQDATPPRDEDVVRCPESTEGGHGTTTPAVIEGDGSPTASPDAAGACHVVIEDFAFSPATIQVEAGTTVVWAHATGRPTR